MNAIRISGKNLGQLAMPRFCPRCLWIKLKCQGKIPFAFFPGIFSSIDSFSKKITNAYYRNHGRLPHWFDGLGHLGEPIRVPHHTTFNTLNTANNILLTGVPDEVLRRPNGEITIVDYKTARCSDNQDALLPTYEVQLNTYALIAEQIGLGKVRSLALVYFQPPDEIDDSELDASTLADGFAMSFCAKVLPLALEPERIPPLLARVREIHDLATAPEGRNGCKDCHLLNRLVELAAARNISASEQSPLVLVTS